MMKLHSSLGPNPRLARMFLMEKGLVEGTDFERVHYDIITGENRSSADYTAKNPLGTTPTLELDDGTCLTESWPICEFIEEHHPAPNLFGETALERAEDLLGKHRYLTGNHLTEADLRLWTTLVRFDPVYVTHFKCDRRRISDYPNLYGFLRDIYQMEGVAACQHQRHDAEEQRVPPSLGPAEHPHAQLGPALFGREPVVGVLPAFQALVGPGPGLAHVLLGLGEHGLIGQRREGSHEDRALGGLDHQGLGRIERPPLAGMGGGGEQGCGESEGADHASDYRRGRKLRLEAVLPAADL